MVATEVRVEVKVENRLQWIVRQCKGRDVLDVGCVGEINTYGHPEWLHGLIKKSAKSVLGIDNNVEGIKQLKRQGYNVKVADAENFRLSHKFDTIIASEVIEHLSNPGLFLKCARLHLKEGGRLVLTTPNAYFPPNLFFEQAQNKHHVCTFAMQLLKQLLQRNGFKIISERYLNWGTSRFLLGRLYRKIVLPFSPKYANALGIIAKPS